MTSAPARMAATVSAARASRSARVLVSSEMVTTGAAGFGLLLGEVRLLVLGAAAGEDVEERVVAVGALDLAARRGELELGEVRARGEAREVRWAQHELAVEDPHAPLPLIAPPCPRDGGTVTSCRALTCEPRCQRDGTFDSAPYWRKSAAPSTRKWRPASDVVISVSCADREQQVFRLDGPELGFALEPFDRREVQLIELDDREAPGPEAR